MAASSPLKPPLLPQTLTSSKFQLNPSPQLKFTPTYPIYLSQFKIFSCLSVDQTAQNHSLPTKPTKDLRIVFAAGGTGGHINPAIAIADELKNINPNIQILFLGTKNGMESTLVPSSGYTFVPIQAFRLTRPLLSPQNLVFPFYLIKSVMMNWKILRAFDPHVVVGTGGYVSAPVCLSAGLMKKVIQEQNSKPGLANFFISNFADMIFVAFPSSVTFFPKGKCVVSGNPIKLSMRRYVSKAVAILNFFPKAKKASEAKVVLVLGGSLGANAINMAMLNVYSQMLLEHKNRFIIWQTGVAAFNEMESLVNKHSRLVLTPFLHTMDLAYAAADLVVSRAGAMTCSEVLAIGKPSILIPSPIVAEGHQMKNASVMSDLAGSKVLTENELDSNTLTDAIEEILGDESQMADVSKKAMNAARPDASLEIAQYILSLVESSAVKWLLP